MKRKLGIAMLGLSLIFGFGTSNFALAANTGGPGTTTNDTDYPTTYQVPGNDLKTTIVTTDDANDNGLVNANKSGTNVSTNDGSTVGEVIKSHDMNLKYDKDGNRIDGNVTQRTHGEYQNNTNSCASCHQTHTGASDNLLFKSGVYETCTACHDGTLGFYNVFTPSTAGTFGGTQAGNASMHLANGLLETKAAPGGNRTLAGTEHENWTGEFTCASCHAPHGSYSDRLLAYNPNHIASTPMYDDAAGSITGKANEYTGGQMVRGAVVNALPVATEDNTSPAYVIYQTTVGTNPGQVNIDAKYAAAGDQVIVVMKKVQNATTKAWEYVKDTAPWIMGGEFNHAHTFKVNFTTLYTGDPLNLDSTTNTQITTGVTYNYQQGFAKVTADQTGKNMDVSRAYVVKFTFDEAVTKWYGAVGTGVAIKTVDPTVYDNALTGVAVSTFCAACHTDYLTKSSDTEGTGVWSKAFRHSTNSANYTCLKCHFAHGTDVSVMLDAKDRNVSQVATDLFAGDSAKAHDYMLDKNASSALKRYTNMSVCWKCHTQSHNVDLMNNDYVNNVSYDASTENDRPNGWVKPPKANLPYLPEWTNPSVVTTP